MNPAYLAIPIIGAIIGWGTNFLAIKMLFRPRRAKNLLGYTIQGVIPKRQPQIASAVGEAVEKGLVRKEDLAQAMKTIGIRYIGPFIDSMINERLRLYKLNSISLIDGIHKKTTSALKTYIKREVVRTLESKSEVYSHLAGAIDIKGLVTNRINGFSVGEMEKATFSVIKSELRFIELVGAAIGFMIGLVQLLILYIYKGI